MDYWLPKPRQQAAWPSLPTGHGSPSPPSSLVITYIYGKKYKHNSYKRKHIQFNYTNKHRTVANPETTVAKGGIPS